MDEIEITFARSSGPGGQNVNKVSSKAVLRWNLSRSTSLPDDVRTRFLARYRNRVTSEGDVLVTSQRYRDQARNVADAIEKLRTMLAAAAFVPKKRKPTKPTRASVERHKKSKEARSRKKQMRRGVESDE
jgi:ribosome-associated protein